MAEHSAGERTETRAGFDPDHLRAVIAAGGELPTHVLIRCHVRYFNDGVAIGSRGFVEEVFTRNRAQFGARRRDGARRMRGGPWDDLFCLRNLTAALAAPG